MIGDVAGLRVLDVGAGDGRLARELARSGASVVGIDPDAAMLREAARLGAESGLSVALVRGRVQALPFRSASFDLVTAVTVLCFVADEEAAWAEMARVLKPGGRLVIGELNRWSVWALWRRLRGWLGHPLWQQARFRSARALCWAARRAGLAPLDVRGAVFHPPSALLARLTQRIDAQLGRLTTFAAAFIALAARKPGALQGGRRRAGQGAGGSSTA